MEVSSIFIFIKSHAPKHIIIIIIINKNNVIYIAPFTMCSKRWEESRKRWDLSLFLILSIWSTVRTLLGSPLQRWGPATDKARSPACFFGRGTSNVMAKSERRPYLVLWTRDWKYEDKYPGELKWKALKAWTMSLKRILFSIGSQWRDCRRGEAWVRLGCFRISWAHLFWRTWRRLRLFLSMPYKREWQ